ncbi:hypothetical protein EVG20_g6372 [Dentipellis fragilis]|uniref:F-box domain-containing protein n=1 Tax=Dentipellis fragilis TaxID=205917 RepID=A0A4Y9YLK1_9AGAM|nr:hypothetical protein EVG20_g6372 [Dentipellis fragilis]
MDTGGEVALKHEDVDPLDVAVLKQRQNFRSLVCSSSFEILQHIFHSYVGIDETHGFPLNLRNHRIPLPALLSQVCTRWREACLSDCRLWSCIPFGLNQKWASEFVARSGESSLEISSFLDANPLPLALVRGVMHRIRRLRVVGNLDELQDFCDAIANKPAPVLEYLFFRGYAAYNSNILMLHIPSTIFVHVAPRLRSAIVPQAHLEGFPMPAFTHLTSIHLYILTASDTVRLLQNSPHLKELHCNTIRDCPLESTPNLLVEGERVHAPELTTLVIRNIKLAGVISFFEALDAPSLSELTLKCIEIKEEDVQRYATALPRVLSAHIKTLHHVQSPCDELKIDGDNSEYSTVECCSTGSGEERTEIWRDSGHASASHLYLRWIATGGNGAFDTQSFLASLLRAFSAHDVRILNLRDRHGHLGRSSGCLQAFPCVTLLHYSRSDTKEACRWDIFEAMTPMEQRIHTGQTSLLGGQTLFPLLTKLVIHDSFIPQFGGVFLRVLRRLAQSRKHDGQLLEIAFEECSYSAHVMAELKKDAVITWNGAWCPPFSFGGIGEDPELENWEMWGSMFDEP